MRGEFDTQTIKKRIDPEVFYGREGVSIGRSNSTGWCSAGLCPFHSDRRAGNFRVNIHSGGFICFACGAKGGDVIEFTRRLYELNFLGALKRLQNDYS